MPPESYVSLTDRELSDWYLNPQRSSLTLEELRKATEALKQRTIGGEPAYIKGKYTPGWTDDPIDLVFPDEAGKNWVARMGTRDTPSGQKARIEQRGDVSKHLVHPADLAQMSPAEREAFNRSVLLHEGRELDVAQGRPGSVAPFESHLSVKPMLQDLNIAANLNYLFDL